MRRASGLLLSCPGSSVVAMSCWLLWSFNAAQAQDYQPTTIAPAHWGAFAKLVTRHFEDGISADDQVSNRFRSYVLEHRDKADGPPQVFTVQAWVGPHGTIEKVAFPSLKNAQADGDLRTILTRGTVGVPPPPDLLQPLNLRLSLNIK
ncbi:conserved exported hypothetical protein [Bradyrhizobium sp. STM 3843]|uniref:hypothetical protein n=1 Tax=Bradyrhizobium sp. STM 3843 TaxID=551947 RepID=UPI000240AE2B|nr:hypothetical protein [Bradyrhizobium sp. STM 3843]CCE05265.1 conserved exported hypothetical protein [Bradyrhizobium sp. STM 3843]